MELSIPASARVEPVMPPMKSEETISTWDVPPRTRRPMTSPNQTTPRATPISDSTPPKMMKSGSASQAKLPSTPITAIGDPSSGMPATSMPTTPASPMAAASGTPKIASENKTPKAIPPAISSIGGAPAGGICRTWRGL